MYGNTEQRKVREQICLQHHRLRNGFIDMQHSVTADRDDFRHGWGHGFAPRGSRQFTQYWLKFSINNLSSVGLLGDRSYSFDSPVNENKRQWPQRTKTVSFQRNCDAIPSHVTYQDPTLIFTWDSFHALDCVTERSHVQSHTFCWPRGGTTKMKNQQQTPFALIREPLSGIPSQSMLLYCTHSTFTTALTSTVGTNWPGPSGSHLISGTTKLSVEPFGLTYNQSHSQKRFDRLFWYQ